MDCTLKYIYKYWTLVIIALALCIGTPARAQDVTTERGAGVHQQDNKNNRDQRKREEDLKKKTNPKISIKIDSPQDKIDLTKLPDKKSIPLKQIVFSPKSSIEDTPSLKALVEPYLNRNVSLKDLHTLRIAINKLYAKKGYIANVVLLDQEIKQGRVIFTTIEGKVGKFKIQSTRLLQKKQGYPAYQDVPDEKLLGMNKKYLLDTLGIKQGDVVHSKRIEDALIRFNLLNDAKLRVKLGAGASYGLTDIDLVVDEPEPFELSYYFDNAGRVSTGKFRHGLSATVRNITGRGDTLFVNGIHTTGGGSTNAYFNYTLPVTTQGTRLTLSYDHSQYEIIKGANRPLDINGLSQTIGLGLAQPFVLGRNQLFNIYTNISDYNARSYFAGTQQTRDRFLTITPGFSYEVYSDKHTFIMDHSFAFGLNSNGYDEAYSIYRNSFTYINRPNREWSIVTRLSGQLTKEKNLPASQQFIVGGISSVRGYSEGVLSGDDGYYLRTELRRNILSRFSGPVENDRPMIIDGFAFIDHGGAFPFKGAGESVDKNDFLTSVGIGASMEMIKKLSARVTLAVPITGTDEDLDYQSVRVHFYFQWNF